TRKRALGAARRTHHRVAVDEHAFAVAPFAHHLAAEVRGQALAPHDGPLDAINADEIAVAAEGVQAVAVHRGRAVRPFAPRRMAEQFADLGAPRLARLLALQVEGDDVFRIVEATHRVHHIADDGRPGVTHAGVLVSPQQCRPALRPLLHETHLLA